VKRAGREVTRWQQPPSIQVEDLTAAISMPTPSGLDLPLVEVNIGLLADQVGVSSSNTLDLSQGDHDLSSTLDVGVEETENVLLVERASRIERSEMSDASEIGCRALRDEYRSGVECKMVYRIV
jgi:hypothetical protein